MTMPFAAIRDEDVLVFRRSTGPQFVEQPEPIQERPARVVLLPPRHVKRRRRNWRAKLARAWRFVRDSSLNIRDDLVLWAYGKGLINMKGKNG